MVKPWVIFLRMSHEAAISAMQILSLRTMQSACIGRTQGAFGTGRSKDKGASARLEIFVLNQLLLTLNFLVLLQVLQVLQVLLFHNLIISVVWFLKSFMIFNV